jgi:PhnB protein
MTTSNTNLTVQPYLFFRGSCEEALNFYRDSIGADVQILMRFSDSPEPHPGVQPGNENKVMHATCRIGQTTFMASDGQCEGQPKFEGFSLAITVPNESDADRVFAALGQGGKVEMPLTKTFWTSKFGMLEDRFGVGWMVSVEHKP